MPKKRARKYPSKQSSSKLPKVQKTSEASNETKIIIKRENIETQEAIPVLDVEPKNSGNHLRLVEKDLLEFTNTLSKTIGSRRKNVLSALVVTADITIPASEEPEPSHSGPIRACLCELKGRDEGNVVICEKNCCCIIFLDKCHCGFELPVNPSKLINIKEAAFVGNDYLASKTPKLLKNVSHGSIKQNAQRCFHGPREKIEAKTESCSQPSATRPATCTTASAHPHVAKNTWCRVVELTEREHLILSRAEKSQKSITNLSRSTRKNHGVQIFFMKQLREVHIRGTNYHQGLQELLKQIKRAAEWWESHRSATDSDDRCSKDGPTPINGFHQNASPRVQRFPPWNNFNHFSTIRVPHNPTLDHYLLDSINSGKERLQRIIDEMSERSSLRTFNPAKNLHVPVRR